MQSRCTKCNKYNNFRNQRGAKLSERKCDACNSGPLEIMSGGPTLAGKHPFDQEYTYPPNQWHATEYHYSEKNRKGEIFILYNRYYHKVENPVIAEKPLENTLNSSSTHRIEAEFPDEIHEIE